MERNIHLVNWMREQGMAAVCVNAALDLADPELWVLIEAEIGSGFESGFIGDGGNIRVLHVTAP